MTNGQMILEDDSTKRVRLYIAFELSNSKWKMLFSDGIKRREKTIRAKSTKELEEEIEKSKKRFKLREEAETISCYEAGRDGFWLHRYLESRGIRNLVVDPASIEVNRRYRRVKTDRIDVKKLLTMLIRYEQGESKVWSVVRVPSVAEEDARRTNREIERLKKEKTGHSNRIKSLLILHGIETGSIGEGFLEGVEECRQWNGEGIPEKVKKEIRREYARYNLVKGQLKELEGEKKARIERGDEAAKKVVMLQKLVGIGPVSSWELVFEFFGWRRFRNVKEVGAAAGLAPSVYKSGDIDIGLGITKAGNRRIRKLMIELGWGWLRYQTGSQISRWFAERFGKGSRRVRRIGIVAVARKLLVALWKYLEKGIVPEGARLKA